MLVICLTVSLVALFARNLIYTTRPFPGHSRDHTPRQDMSAAQPSLIVHYHERSPYYITDADSLDGLCGKRAERIFKEAGIRVQWQQTPAKRQLDIIKKNQGRECALGWFKTPEREKFAQFSLPVYRDKPTIAIARADNEKIQTGQTLDSVLTNFRLHLLKKEGYSYGRLIDRKIKAHHPHETLTTASNTGMLKMIRNHRADYMFIAEEEAEDLLRKTGTDASTFKFIRFTDMPDGNYRHIICTPKVDAEILQKINKAIRATIDICGDA